MPGSGPGPKGLIVMGASGRRQRIELENEGPSWMRKAAFCRRYDSDSDSYLG
jgi:hypothetical protein